MNYILIDLPKFKENLLPLTYFRPIGLLRIGIDTIKEKWESFLDAPVSFLSDEYLREKFPVKYQNENIYIAGHILPHESLVNRILQLKKGQALFDKDSFIAYKGDKKSLEEIASLKPQTGDIQAGVKKKILFPWDIISINEEQIKEDFDRITSGKKSAPLSDSNKIIGTFPVFIEESAKAEACIFNTTAGPVYLGKNSCVMEGSLLRGPMALLDNAVIKMGAKIYGGTTIGPNSKVGGEIKNAVFLGNSNKGHDGYLGDSVIAEWCNLGAGTNNSNLKNNYSQVKMWHYPSKTYKNTGLQFCGMIMGDHSKAGISTMFNTGTVAGVSSNIFGGDFQPKFIPSFKWGNKQEMQDYRFDKALEVAKTVMQRRNVSFDETEKRLFENIYKLAKQKEKI